MTVADAVYTATNALWIPVADQIGVFTMADGLKLARHLWGKFGGRTVRYPYRDANMMRGRRVWASSPTNHRSLARGARRVVHDVSHALHHARSNGRLLDHCLPHAELERDMVRYVIEAGLYRKVVEPKPTTDQRRARELGRTIAGIRRWETKAKRANTALKKLRLKARRLNALVAGSVQDCQKLSTGPL
jgi:hypothetical protein